MRSLAVLAALALITAVAGSAAAAPDAEHPWDATWAGGWEDTGSGEPDGVQVVVADNEVVAFFIHGDYPDIDESDPLGDDGSLAFSWMGGHATLKRAGEAYEIVVDEDGLPERVVALKQDQ